MKLDRNINPDGCGKYALLKLRELADRSKWATEVFEAIDMLAENGIIDYGGTPETDFFVIRLKDKYAAIALAAYAEAAQSDDPEYAAEVGKLAAMARLYPQPRIPD